MKKRNYIKKISDYSMVGGLGAVLVLGLVGCNDTNQQQNQSGGTITNAAQQQGAFVVVEQAKDGSYKIADEFPAAKTTIVLRSPDGTERILSQEEIDKLVKEEEAKIDAGTSPLTNPQLSDGGMGLGGVLLSSIAGAMIGSWLGNKLFNNQNFQNQKAAQYKSPQTYSKSQSSFNKPAGSTGSSTGAGKQSGFFGNKSSTTGSTNNSTSTGG
ncbi:putative lipoprotein [Aliarcobacter faecis]|uniref:UPF0323 family lipoprotein n=1 Tax=Aliarcobacter faecis TaxID=1564138 RepID=UPI000479B665|nr:UPF0323 family lipoprotein [Aliarcobacter faecis]QKF73523.1 putative lipoprotein [Aliarcobacter faecis]